MQLVLDVWVVLSTLLNVCSFIICNELVFYACRRPLSHHLFDHLREEPQFQLALGANTFEQSMRFRVGTAVHCPACGRRSDKFRGDEEGISYVLHVSASQFSTPSFANALALLTVTSKITERCGHCMAAGEKTKHAVYQSPPQVLFVQIERWDGGRKCALPLAVPVSAHVDMFNQRYRLAAAAVHYGKSVRTGHWTALVPRAGTWFSASDSTVQPADIADTLADPLSQSNVAAVIFEKEAPGDERK